MRPHRTRLLHLLLLAASVSARHRREGPTVKAPAAFTCPHARSCECGADFVRCTNAQLRNADIFVDIAARFPRIREVAVSGNSLMGLRAPIFATPDGKPLRHLHRLLIPNNYLVELHSDVFLHTPNLHLLDLSFNEIKLSKPPSGFLRPLQRLRHLVLRKGFSRPLKYDQDATSRQLSLLEGEFAVGNLTELADVDLSINFIRYIPAGFGCALTGSLKKLILDGNEIAALTSKNLTCLYDLHLLSLQRNMFSTLKPETRLALGTFSTGAVQLAENKIRCDCHGYSSVEWLRFNQTAIADYAEIRCGRWNRASAGLPIAAVPLRQFTCANAAAPVRMSTHLLLLLTLLFTSYS